MTQEDLYTKMTIFFQKHDSQTHGRLLRPPSFFVLCSFFHRLPIVLLFLLTSRTQEYGHYNFIFIFLPASP